MKLQCILFSLILCVLSNLSTKGQYMSIKFKVSYIEKEKKKKN